jgi:hypothetical protein
MCVVGFVVSMWWLSAVNYVAAVRWLFGLCVVAARWLWRSFLVVV